AEAIDATAEKSIADAPEIGAEDQRTGVLSTAVHELTGVATGEKRIPEALTAGVENITETVRDRIDERRATRSLLAESAEADGNGVVRARDVVRGALTKAATDVSDALRPGKPDKSAVGAAKTSTNVAKSMGDTARNVVKKVRQAAKDTRDATKDRATSNADE
ncbi:MAG: hypothetical protein WAL26_08915, partial [Mycobacterium sp.]